MTNEELIERWKMIREEKNAPKVDCTKKDLVDAVNLLMCHVGPVVNLTDTVTGLKIFLERVGLTNDCFIAIYSGDYRPRLQYDYNLSDKSLQIEDDAIMAAAELKSRETPWVAPEDEKC